VAAAAEAMDDLRMILSSRESLYARADAVVGYIGSTGRRALKPCTQHSLA